METEKELMELVIKYTRLSKESREKVKEMCPDFKDIFQVADKYLEEREQQ